MWTLPAIHLRTVRQRNDVATTLPLEARDFKFGVHVDHSKFQPTDDKLSLKGVWSLSHDLFFNFWKRDNISKTVQDSLIVSIKSEQEVICALPNGYVADHLGWTLTTLNQLNF